MKLFWPSKTKRVQHRDLIVPVLGGQKTNKRPPGHAEMRDKLKPQMGGTEVEVKTAFIVTGTQQVTLEAGR